jgi:hypothetical protein
LPPSLDLFASSEAEGDFFRVSTEWGRGSAGGVKGEMGGGEREVKESVWRQLERVDIDVYSKICTGTNSSQLLAAKP